VPPPAHAPPRGAADGGEHDDHGDHDDGAAGASEPAQPVEGATTNARRLSLKNTDCAR